MSIQTNWKDSLKAYRSQLMGYMLTFTDPQYQSVRKQLNPTMDELQFIEVYQNVYLMQGLSLMIAFPAIHYMRKSTKYRLGIMRCDPNFTTDQYENLRNRMAFYLSFGMACVISTELYSYKYGLYDRIKNLSTPSTLLAIKHPNSTT